MQRADSNETNSGIWAQPGSTRFDADAGFLLSQPGSTALAAAHRSQSESSVYTSTPPSHVLITNTYDPQGSSDRNVSNAPARMSAAAHDIVAGSPTTHTADLLTAPQTAGNAKFVAAAPLTSSVAPPSHARGAIVSSNAAKPGVPPARTTAPIVPIPLTGVAHPSSSPSPGDGSTNVSTSNVSTGGGGKKSHDTALQRHEKLLLQQRNIYVSGLPPDFKPPELKKLCEFFGVVESVKLCMIDSASLQEELAQRNGTANKATDDATKASNNNNGGEANNNSRSSPAPSPPRRHEIIPACKGYGFVLFRDPESATSCIAALNNKVMWGKPLQVRRADLTAAPPRKGAGPSPLPFITPFGANVVDPSLGPAMWPPGTGVPPFTTAVPAPEMLATVPGYAFAAPAPALTTTTTAGSPTVLFQTRATTATGSSSPIPLMPTPFFVKAGQATSTPPGTSSSLEPTGAGVGTTTIMPQMPYGSFAGLPYSQPLMAAAGTTALLQAGVGQGSALQTFALPDGGAANRASQSALFAPPPTMAISPATPYGGVGDYRIMYVSASSGAPIPMATQPLPEATTLAVPGAGNAGRVVYYVLAQNGQAYAVSGQ